MEQADLNDHTTTQPGVVSDAQAISPPDNTNPRTAAQAPVSPATCASCGAEANSNGNGTTIASYVFAIGRVEMRFPTLAVERNLPRPPGGRIPRDLPIEQPPTRFCRDARIATLPDKFVGFLPSKALRPTFWCRVTRPITTSYWKQCAPRQARSILM